MRSESARYTSKPSRLTDLRQEDSAPRAKGPVTDRGYTKTPVTDRGYIKTPVTDRGYTKSGSAESRPSEEKNEMHTRFSS